MCERAHWGLPFFEPFIESMKLFLTNDPWFASMAPSILPSTSFWLYLSPTQKILARGKHGGKEGEIAERGGKERSHRFSLDCLQDINVNIYRTLDVFFWLHEKLFPFLDPIFLLPGKIWNIYSRTAAEGGRAKAPVRIEQGESEKMTPGKEGKEQKNWERGGAFRPWLIWMQTLDDSDTDSVHQLECWRER